MKIRLERIITTNGIGGFSYDKRFVLTAKIVEMSKNFVPGTPPIYNYDLEVTFMIGDIVDGTLFSSHSVEIKGAGNTVNKAYLTAIKSIKDKSSEYQEFLSKAKDKIMEYYNSKCDFYLKEAATYASKNEFESAIATLTSIPEVCKECYDKAMDAVAPIYQKQIDRQCKILMNEAQNAWNKSQNVSGASEAAIFLGQIDPSSSCYKEASTLSNSIGKRIKELDQREWEFKLKEQKDEVDIRKATIQAARDIGVAYGKNQPKTVTYVRYRGWW